MKFSVAMCVYGGDAPESFRDAVDSVFQQSLVPSEVVVVVDGPVPEPMSSLFAELADAYPLIHFHHLEQNVGHGDARRIAMEQCSHSWVALMDADDIALPDRFLRQVNVVETHPDVSIVGGWIQEFEEVDGERKLLGERQVPETPEEITHQLRWNCPINQPTVLMNKEHVLSAGGYKDWYCNEDYYLWVRMVLAGFRLYNVPENLLLFRVDRNTYKRRAGWRYFRSEARMQWFLFRNKLSPVHVMLFGISVRFVVQVLLPNRLRQLFYDVLMRK